MSSNPFSKDGSMTKVLERVPAMNNVIYALHTRAGNHESAARARKVNPLGKNGDLTQLFEHVPVVNSGIHALHEAVGNDDSADRAKKVNPLGKDGHVTQNLEHVPVVNNCIRMLHVVAGNDGSDERAKNVNPLGKNGSFTEALEHVPVVNSGIQALHTVAGNGDAALRARNANPLGKDGSFTEALEHVPVVNNAIQALHATAGNGDAALRAKEVNPLGKDGSFTEALEHVLVVNNGIRALHAATGNGDAAERARKVNPLGKDGVLTRSIEKAPLLNLIACALHIAGDNSSQALRAFMRNCDAFSIEAQSIRVLTRGGSLNELTIEELSVIGLNVKPPGLVAAIAQTANLDELIRSMANQKLRKQLQQGTERIPDIIASGIKDVDERIYNMRADSLLLFLCLPPRMPMLTNEDITAIQQAAPTLPVRYGDMPALCSVTPSCPEKLTDVKLAMFQGSATVSCLAFTGMLGLGTHTGGIACLAGLIAGITKLGQELPRYITSRLDRHNATVTGTGSAALTVGVASPLVQGVIAEFPTNEFEQLARLAKKYMLVQCYSKHPLRRWVPRLERWVSDFVSMVLGPVKAEAIPLAIDVEVLEQVVPISEAAQVTIPETHHTLFLTLCAQGQVLDIKEARLFTSYETISFIAESIRAQIVNLDLRDAIVELSAFSQPVKLSLNLSISWDSNEQLRVNVDGVRCISTSVGS